MAAVPKPDDMDRDETLEWIESLNAGLPPRFAHMLPARDLARIVMVHAHDRESWRILWGWGRAYWHQCVPR